MKINNLFGRSVVLLGIASSIAFNPTVSQAVLLPPGTQLPAPFEPEPVGGVPVGGPLTVNYSSPQIQGTVTSRVYSGDVSNPWVGVGGLTFTYEIVANAASLVAVQSFTASSFLGFQTDVSYENFALPGVAPNTIDRDLTSTVVGFDFFPGILPGQNSALLVIQTDAAAYVVGTGGVIDGTTDYVDILAPALIPEPTTFALLGLGAFGLMMARRRS